MYVIKCVAAVGNPGTVRSYSHTLTSPLVPLQWLVADELEQVNNTANLTYTRPFDRGYLNDWRSEHQVWRRVLGPEGLLKVRRRDSGAPMALDEPLLITTTTNLTRRPTRRRAGCC